MSQPKTIRVRIAVIINADGVWSAFGFKNSSDESMRENANISLEGHEENHDTVHWIEADIPVPVIPAPQTIEGTVTP